MPEQVNSVASLRRVCKSLGLRCRLRRLLIYGGRGNSKYIAYDKNHLLRFSPPKEVFCYIQVRTDRKQSQFAIDLATKHRKNNMELAGRPMIINRRIEDKYWGWGERTDLYYLEGISSVDFGITRSGKLGTFLGIIHDQPLDLNSTDVKMNYTQPF